VATALPDTPLPPLDERLHIRQVTYDSTGNYAFPIAADPSLYFWTYHHWDDSNAIDFKARFGLNYEEYELVTNAPIVAITTGTLLNYSGPRGGEGYILQGDDGQDYYYAHLLQKFVDPGSRVTVGEVIGVMGNTGGSAQYIEQHLHMSMGVRGSLWSSPGTVTSSEFILAHFDLPWQAWDQPVIAYDTALGWPVQAQDLVVMTTFDQSITAGFPQAAIELGFNGPAPDQDLDVVATMEGQIVVNRWTQIYGSQVQIHNPISNTTIVFSSVDTWLVEDGDVVQRGQVIARWNPSHSSRLRYRLFQADQLIDPAQTLGVALNQ
jgi:murein DD-endopeptidase MepM/ murein hydrolase activator NlpD